MLESGWESTAPSDPSKACCSDRDCSAAGAGTNGALELGEQLSNPRGADMFWLLNKIGSPEFETP